MIEIIKQQFSETMANEDKLNRVREFLQIATLKILYDKGWFNNLSFVGGTSLRVLYGLKRFSEDLDFSLSENKGYNFKEIVSQIEHEFELYGLSMETKTSGEKTVHSVFLKFNKLLRELGLSALKEQKLSIKLEIDSNPPQGGNLTRTLVNKIYLFNVAHFDLPSSFATKLHACFFRKFVKGRDFYDFIWYVSKKVKPNFLLLNNAIKQTEKLDMGLNESNFKDFLLENLEGINFTTAKKDVERFLEDKKELKLFDFPLIKNSIEAVY